MFEALRLLRLDLAREDGVPAFVVASDRTLREIALLRPRNLDELQLAHGIGPAKADRYGQRILSVVAGARARTRHGSRRPGSAASRSPGVVRRTCRTCSVRAVTGSLQ